MLALLSPAKNLDFSPHPHPPATHPELMDETAKLAVTTRRLTRPKLKQLMGISDDLAALNRDRFAAFDADAAPDDPRAMPAALAFAGDVYRGLQARAWSHEDLTWAQDRLRILSGLYGLLRPLDAIQPYRLEMGTRLATRRGATLYDFWGTRIADAMNGAVAGHEDPTIVNLASDEYFKAVDRTTLNAPVLSMKFEDIKEGKSRPLFLYVKLARGMMARWIVENRVTRAQDLRDFHGEGYRFNAKRSNETTWLFDRPQPEKKAA